MRIRRIGETLGRWFRWRPAAHSSPARGRGPVDHVIILDGTMSSLEEGHETNAGQAYRLLSSVGLSVSVYYEPGVQWQDWRGTPDVLMGRGINRQIRRAYGYLASRYRPGDRIFLIGYSRGAFAVRSLAGVIDSVGLLQQEHATERGVRQAYRHYQLAPGSEGAKRFRKRFCHADASIEMVGVWDTVKALGLRLPLIWRWSEGNHAFHNHHLGPTVRHGFHAVALDETRAVYEPVMWEVSEGWGGHIEQVWFRGTHGDVGGQLGGHLASRPLANIPFVWLMSCAESCGLALPQGWRAQFPCDVQAPSIGQWRGWGRFFLLRSRRIVGRDHSERFHETVPVQSRGAYLARPASRWFSVGRTKAAKS
ncbi:Uncharacterized alpha/beta hydrolase domain [Poseidonocella pacifica]|uniref:Uncharacterized alpha/beta hydrolase domain n=1 Tax=Poseidonocella pacifica TaxID=871651 RepID=A0A1I0W9P2_9RHOB|nr:DUF2235 domain-containing protein [Poseidonocella pacifica]SFA85284.1 Uncharacterized alpha/beta hydrolase domain [Poseidonocella pacifica]